jgi:hypothetical protein
MSFRGARSANPESRDSGFDAPHRPGMTKRKFLLTIFLDAIFTTLLERLFTKPFDRLAQTPAIACVYPARITD